MTSVGWATLDVIPSVRGLRGELEKQSGPGLTAAGLAGGRRFGDAAGSEASVRFGNALRKGAKVAAIGLAGAAAAAFKFGGDALEEAREAQQVGAQTNAVIKSTGRAAKVTAKDVGRLTGRLSDKAGIDDELIQSGANVLLTFKNIRNEAGKSNKIFDAATESALDMSVALDTDLKSASIQVGKALNDPVKGVTALGRAGVQFSEDQKAAIKAMVESGDTLGAQKVILKELDDQFKGSAKAQATEADKLGVAFGNLKEDVGTALIPVMDDLAVFLRKKGIPAARDFAGWVRDDLAPAVKDAADDVKPLIENAKDLAKFLNDLPSAAKIAGITALIGGGAALKLRGGSGGALGSAGQALGLARPVNVFVTNPGFGTGSDGTVVTDKDGKKTKGGKGGAVAVLVGSIFGPEIIKELEDEIMWPWREGPLAPKSQSGPRVEPTRVGFDSTLASIEGVRDKAAGFGRELDLIGAKKIEPKFAVPGLREGRAGLEEFLRLKIVAGEPITPYVFTAPIERAIELLRTMNAELRDNAVPTAGTTGGVGYQHGSGASSANPRAGITIERLEAHGANLDEILRDGQRRLQRQALGGRPS